MCKFLSFLLFSPLSLTFPNPYTPCPFRLLGPTLPYSPVSSHLPVTSFYPTTLPPSKDVTITFSLVPGRPASESLNDVSPTQTLPIRLPPVLSSPN